MIQYIAFLIVSAAVGSAIYLAGRSAGYRQGFARGVEAGTITARAIVYGIRQELRGVLALDEKGASIAHGYDPRLNDPGKSAPPAGDAGAGS